MILEPNSYDEIIEVVKESIASKKKVIAIGTGRHVIGNIKPDIIITMRRLNKILEVSQSDLYVISQTGISIKELNEELKRSGLWLPFDYNGTIGGLTATNLPLWYTYPRELLLGAKFINGEGKVIRSGGKTTKFSSGYKIWKILAGSLGRLGIILEVIYRVLPLPEITILASFDPEEWRKVFEYSPLSVMVIYKDNREIGIAKFAGLKRVIDKIPLKETNFDLDLDGENIVSVISPLGLEVNDARALRKFMKVECSVSLIGKGYTRAYVKDLNGIEEARSSGLNVIVEKGKDFSVENFVPISNTFKLLKRALDPYNVFP
ncbi:MAG: FAD-binding oxidoreductase [Sulfolobaceae archaeon]